MGLTKSSTGRSLLSASDGGASKYKAVLAGSPNVGKSTIFNALTGLRQHTGNWTGKTVSTAVGTAQFQGEDILIYDIPGTYSLLARSEEESVARDFILFGGADCVAVVCDAVCLERNLGLVLQIAEYTGNITVCVNLIDQAEKRGIKYDLEKLSDILKAPVCGCTAKSGKGLDVFRKCIIDAAASERSAVYEVRYDEIVEEAVKILTEPLSKILPDGVPARFTALRMLSGEEELLQRLEKHCKTEFLSDGEVAAAFEKAKEYLGEKNVSTQDFCDRIASGLSASAEKICGEVTLQKVKNRSPRSAADRILTGKYTAFPIMLLMLALIFWITIYGANYPSAILSGALFSVQDFLYEKAILIGVPEVISDILINGAYRVMAWVVSVMLPPMAIFFPMFTLLEDIGVLPRIAYNLDRGFAKCNACGKQALTMCMGFGCNAAGVVGCRIIDSPRERLIAILTNSLVPCNGRFPILITMISMFFVFGSGAAQSVLSALLFALFIVLTLLVTLLVSYLLSRTLLKGEPSAFTIELPPYRCPKILSVIVRSFLDRTLFVLGRAVVAALPAGLIIWTMANVKIGGSTILQTCVGFLNPFASLFGLDGVILMAFILGLPANEIVVPVMIMAYIAGGTLSELEPTQLFSLLVSNGWNIKTALCTILFALFHFPCATTLMTIKKETGSLKWTALSFVIPTLCGLSMCFAASGVLGIFGL